MRRFLHVELLLIKIPEQKKAPGRLVAIHTQLFSNDLNAALREVPLEVCMRYT